MEIIKKSISLNVGQPNNFEMICAMQGDNKSFEITATLYNENKLYNITTDNIKLKGENAIGQSIYIDIDTYTQNTVTFLLNEQILAYDGLVRLVLVFTDSGKQLTTFPFIIKVINSPGDNSNDDFKAISALVEEAEKWANLSKSYAIGTNNAVRDGDSTDNSKYYSEQSKKYADNSSTSAKLSSNYANDSKDYYEKLKKLIDEGEIGSSNILYYETYAEFKTDYDAGNIKAETLVLIKENIDKIYFVKVIPSSNMEWDSTSGDTYQNDIVGEMDAVVFTAKKDYYFPTDYVVQSLNNISVTRNDYTKITVSGTPKANTQITLTSPTEKGTQEAPTGLSSGYNKINGTTTAMEYADSESSISWVACTEDSTSVTQNTWYVRYKETDTLKASDIISIVVRNSKILILYCSSYILYTEDLETWNVVDKSNSNLLPYHNKSYEFAHVGDMLFCSSNTGNDNSYAFIDYTIHNFQESENNIWASMYTTNINGGCCKMVYANDSLIDRLYLVSSNGAIYYINRNDIINLRGNKPISFIHQTDSESFNLDFQIAYGDGYLVIADSVTKKSYYMTHTFDIYNISEHIQSGLTGYKSKLVYGNGKFINLNTNFTDKYQLAILSSNDISNGWTYIEDVSVLNNVFYVPGANMFPQITDIVYNELKKQFIMPFYIPSSLSNDKQNHAGFILYDGENWSRIDVDLPGALNGCVIIEGKLYCFVNNKWMYINNIETGELVDYGEITDSNGNTLYFMNENDISYTLFNTPLWDIDNIETDI